MKASIVADDLKRFDDHTGRMTLDEVTPLSLDKVPQVSPHMGVYQATMDEPLSQQQRAIIHGLLDRGQTLLDIGLVVQNPLVILLVEQRPQGLGLADDP